MEEKELMKQRRKTGLHVMYTLTVQNEMCPVSTLWNEKVLKKNSALLYYSNKMMTFQLLFGQQDKRTRAFCLK